jgi:hypothetical protein
MILHNISIHLFMPAGIDTPGFVEEEKEKPAVTRKIEESDDQISAEKCAEYLIAGWSFLLLPHLVFVLTPSFPRLRLHLPLLASFQLLLLKLTSSRRLCTDDRGRERILSIHLAPHRRVDQGGLERFSTG